ncbi:MAG: OmpA family protein [Flavobacteriaceae bacterium]|nr:OmpA family protein [Flavobacteriaceae bacterium]
MKNTFLSVFSLLVVLVVGNVNAQNEEHPWAITVGANAINYYSAGNQGSFTNHNNETPIFNEFFNAKDQWNMVPSISHLTIGRYIGSGVVIDVSGSYSSINQFNNLGDGEDNIIFLEDDLTDESYVSADLGLNFHINTLYDGAKWIDPYLRGQGGANWLSDEFSFSAGGGLGINFWIAEQWGIKVQSVYKVNFADDQLLISNSVNNLTNEGETNHFQNVIGVIHTLGAKDSDKDGVKDEDDECPETPGLKEFNGCPDTDGDGIQDSEDSCPEIPGTAEFNGCKDTDGDGVADPNDACVNTPGLKELNGCPDADSDGITDAEDGCPNESGPATNNGCPYPDKDGDGVLDKDDQCADTPGTVANNGCPEITEEEIATLNNYAKTILFNSGKSSFKDDTIPVLEAMNAIFKKYPRAKFSIEGHTDSVGSAKNNQLLSERRANAVRDWLIANGIAADRLTAVGFGESKPMVLTPTRAGRAQNRRVEVKLIK